MGGVDLMQELAVLNHGGGGGSSKGTVAHLLLLHLKKLIKYMFPMFLLLKTTSTLLVWLILLSH